MKHLDMSKLLEHIQASISAYSESKLLVAVSGGVDSMVLLSALKMLDYDPVALHVNYHLRGEESEGDEVFIREQCALKNIELHVKHIHLDKILEKEGGNLQNRARNERYNWFRETAEKFDNALVLIGQHQDDQIETFLLQLFRGAGMRGLSAMPKTQDIFLRPLLTISRSEILDFANTNNILWREDSSNSSLKYSRNRLRNEFLPLLDAEVPTLKNDIIYLVEVFQKNYRSIQNKAEKTVLEIFEQSAIDIERLEKWEDEFLIELLRKMDVPTQVYTEIRKLARAKNNKYITIEHKNYNRIVKVDDRLIFVQNKRLTKPELVVEQIRELPEQFSKEFIFLDGAKISGTLRLRQWKEGDKIASLGVNGSQLVSKILHDAKVPIAERENYYVLCDDIQIHWCPQYKVGRNALASPSSAQILKCTITYKEYA